jgi:hypothetical protein
MSRNFLTARFGPSNCLVSRDLALSQTDTIAESRPVKKGTTLRPRHFNCAVPATVKAAIVSFLPPLC